MLRKIEKIRQQPKEVRNRYAFWVALLFTAVVTVFWVSSLPTRMQVLTGVVPVEMEETEGGFSRMWNNMKASVLDGVPDAVIEVAPQEKVHQVSMDEFMASSSQKAASAPQAPQGRPILIGTSTKLHGTSTER